MLFLPENSTLKEQNGKMRAQKLLRWLTVAKTQI